MEPRSVAKLPTPGMVLSGKYVVERVIASGGMGVVLAARHARLGHRVAVKVLQPYTRTMPQIAGRFEREARASAQIRSRNVARVIDVDVLPDGSPFMVMEFLEGHDLGVELEKRGSFPPAEAVGYVVEACAGMAEAHRLGIVHRDLKPSNLFLAVEEGQQIVKVLDFGISKLTADTDVRMTATNSVLGTPLYMSPEQVRSAKNVDARTDIWSLGVILYEMLSGELPFLGESATAVAASIVADDAIPLASRRPELPPGLADVVMKALRKKPEARFQDIKELVSALKPFDGKARSRRPSTLILVTGAAAAEVSAEARTMDGVGPDDDAGIANPLSITSEEDASQPLAATAESSPPPPKHTLASSAPPPAAEARREGQDSRPAPAPDGGDIQSSGPGGAAKTAPGWTGATADPPRTGSRRVLFAAVAVVGLLASAAMARSLQAPRGVAPAPAGVESAPVVASRPPPSAEPAPAPTEAPTAAASASAAPVVSPAPASASVRAGAEPVPGAALKKPSPPRGSPAPTAQPGGAPAGPKPAATVGLPSHI